MSQPPRLRFTPPSIPAVVFIILATVVPILLQKPVLNSDGDLARHLRHGRYMLEHHQLIKADPFSFTRPGVPFVGFEYGSQLLYALAERVGGLPGVAILAGFLIALTYTLLTRFLLSRGVDPFLACLIVALAIVLGAGHWSARPHLFSFVAVVLLLGLLEGKPRRPFLTCALLFFVWANLHGGFVYGWILIVIYLIGSAAESLWSSEQAVWKEQVRYYLTLFITATVATLFNPHGLALQRHVLEFLNKRFIMDNTAEFLSPDFHELGSKVFLAILLLCLGPLSLYPRRPALPRLLMLCVGVAFALMSVRNIPLFGLTALPILALHLNEVWRQVPDPGGVRARFAATAHATSTLPWALPVAILLCGLAVGRGRIGSLQLIRDEFDSTIFPVAAVAKARQEHLGGHLFSEYTWGGYLIYAWPAQKIYMDGGTDFFGEDLFREFTKIRQMSPGWRDLLEKRDISLMLLSRGSALAHELTRDPGWRLWYCDSLAVILLRSRSTAAATPAHADSAEQVLEGCAVRPLTLVAPRPAAMSPRGAGDVARDWLQQQGVPREPH
jgi:hypothetical protein